MRRVAAALACASIVGAAAFPTVAAAQSSWREQISRQIADSRIVSTLRSQGYTETHSTFYDIVERGARKSVTLELQAGRTYRFVGKCDNDCTDLDFRLYDDNGNQIDSDVSTDDVPLVTVTPRRSGSFRLDVTMARCSVSVCGWGVVVLGSPRDGSSSEPNTMTPVRTASNSVSNSGSNSEATWQGQIRRQLESSSLVSTYRSQGYTDVQSPIYRLVPSGNSSRVSFDLQAGRTYKFVGKCDNDCSDLDFRLYDENDNQIDSDVGTDDVPLVTVTPRRSATFSLKVTMATCRTSQCGWGVASLVK